MTMGAGITFPRLALSYDEELIIDTSGERWRLSTESQHNRISRSYTLFTKLQHGDEIITGRFIVSDDLLAGLDEDEDLRVLAIAEIRKYLDGDHICNGFIFDLPYKRLIS